MRRNSLPADVPSHPVTDAHLILFGVHGKGMLKQILPGPAMSHLLRKGEIPVLAVADKSDESADVA